MKSRKICSTCKKWVAIESTDVLPATTLISMHDDLVVYCGKCFKKIDADLVHTIERLENYFENEEKLDVQKENVEENDENENESNATFDALLFEREELFAELGRVKQMENELERLEGKFLRESNEFVCCLNKEEVERCKVRARIKQVRLEVDTLKRSNVYNDIFHISYDGYFGTISGLRLGQRMIEIERVPWDEINAGFSQLLLLMECLAQATEFRFTRFEINVKDVKMIDQQKNVAYELRGPVNIGFFGHSSLDMGLVCFLACVLQVTNFLKELDKNWCPKYTIDLKRGLIGEQKDKMVRIQRTGSTDEEWTQALKYLLINMKYLIALVARYFPPS